VTNSIFSRPHPARTTCFVAFLQQTAGSLVHQAGSHGDVKADGEGLHMTDCRVQALIRDSGAEHDLPGLPPERNDLVLEGEV